MIRGKQDTERCSALNGGEKMDNATMKQKAYIRELFLGQGFRWRNINPLEFWNISRREASELIHDLKVLQRHYSGDLRDMICQSIIGKNIVYNIAETIEEMEEEEEQEDWPDQLTYKDDIQSNEWIHEPYLSGLKKQEVTA